MLHGPRKRRHRRRLSKRRLVLASLIALAGPAAAQSPEKFERPVPPRVAPAKPPAQTPSLEQQPLVVALIRKANLGEKDDGLCAGLNWPTLNLQSYLEYLERAKIGSARINTFPGTLCRFYRVTDVYQGPTGKCVRTSWWGCQTGRTCGRGEFAECKQANGEWK